MKASSKIAASLAGALLMVGLGAAVAFSAFSQIEESADSRKHIFQVLDAAETLLSSITDAETGQRGYLLTGNETFLEPYNAVRDTFVAQQEALHGLTQIPAAQAHLDTIAPLLQAKLDELSRLIALRRGDNLVDVQALVLNSDGERLMDSIRVEVKAFTSIEQEALATHDAELQESLRELFTILLIASFFMLLLAFSFTYVLYQRNQLQLNNTVQLETQQVMKIHEETNLKLQQANTSLQVSEENLAVTLSSIGDAVMATDAEGRVMLLNPVAERLLGWTRQEATGHSADEIFQIINQGNRERTKLPIMETLDKGTIHGLANHTILIARDGSERPIADSCSPIRDRSGKILGAVLVFRDVTQEHKTAQILQDKTTLIQTILNTVGDCIITFQADGGIIDTVNPATEKLFGYTAEALIGQSFALLIPELVEAQRNNNMAYYKASEEALSLGLGRELLGRRHDGSTFPVELVISEMLLGEQRYFTGILRDLSLRKQAGVEQQKLDQRLRDQQFYTRSLIESNIDALMTTDPAGIITDVNKQMEALTDRTRDELVGAPFMNYFTDPERAEAGIKRVLSEKKVTNYELTVRARDGKETTVSYNATTFYDRDRNLQGVFAAARDVTERNRAEAKFRGLIESAPDAMVIINRAGEIVLINTQTEQAFGYLRSELLGQKVECLIPDRFRSQHPALRGGYFTDAKIRPMGRAVSLCAKRKDGSEFPVEISLSPLETEEGLLVSATIRDITTRQQIEEAQQTLDAFKRAILNSVEAEIAVVDLNGVILEVNEPWLRFTADNSPGSGEFLPKVAVGANYLKLDAATSENQLACQGIQAVLDGTSLRFNLEYSCGEPGHARWFSMNVLPLGQVTRIGAVIAHTDITESKLLGQALQEKNTELELAKSVAEKANQAKSEFLSSMSHELRSPLNAILGFAQLMDSDIPPPSTSQKASIGRILHAGWYLLELINEILDLAVIESGKLSMSLEPVSIGEVMLECQSITETQAKQRRLSMNFPVFAIPCFVMADRIRVKQILINLLSNAIKYNRRSGSIIIECTASGSKRIRISVRDTGQGLPLEKVRQLFQPFNRLGQEAGLEEGTGIGLVMSKLLAELMGGRIGVESVVGVGSVFWFELPAVAMPRLALDSSEQPAVIAAESTTPSGAVRTLLYVEDNAANLELVERLIARRRDLRLLSAMDGHLGVEIARTQQPQVILMDINLPGISGIQALRLLKDDPATMHIPVIAISANAMVGDVKRGQDAGFFRYLTKPINVREFMEALDTALAFAEQNQSKNTQGLS